MGIRAFLRRCGVLFLIGISVIWLHACQSSKSSSHLWENYLYRLTNSLEVERSPLPEVPLLPPYPQKSQLEHPIPSIHISLLEFLRLSQCDLQRYIGQRNSSLGQLMEASQKWIYEVEFIRLARQCLEVLPPSSEDYGRLQQVVDQKVVLLPLVAWNATFASPEFSYLFSLGAQPISIEQARINPVELKEAIGRLAVNVTNSSQHHYHLFDGHSLESHYAVIGSRKQVGALRLSLQQAVIALHQADSLLRQRLGNKPLCFNAQANPRFRTVNTVFRKYYIGQVQPYLAQLYRQAEDIFYALNDLYLSQKATEPFNIFWQQVYVLNNGEWHKFQRAIKSHTVLWQRLLTQCGELPH